MLRHNALTDLSALFHSYEYQCNINGSVCLLCMFVWVPSPFHHVIGWNASETMAKCNRVTQRAWDVNTAINFAIFFKAFCSVLPAQDAGHFPYPCIRRSDVTLSGILPHSFQWRDAHLNFLFSAENVKLWIVTINHSHLVGQSPLPFHTHTRTRTRNNQSRRKSKHWMATGPGHRLRCFWQVH